MPDTQNQSILNWLKTGASLTPWDALQMFGCFRLAARIHDLRERGHNIEMEMVEKENGRKYARYWLEPDAQS